MLHGFQITHKLHESEHSIVYRAQRTADSRPVVLKMLNSQYPSPRELARFRQELALLEAARGPGVIEAHGLERLGHTLVLVLEDVGGESLDQAFHDQQPSIERFLQLAIQIAAAVGHVHRRGVIHKAVTPSNIVWNRDTAELKLIDFGIATQLASEAPPRQGPRAIEGSMAYVSPEQTGRMNRHLDYRTDLYSLGVTLYELLTGSLPFRSQDPLELVHCHIAAQPTPPIELREDIPLVLSAMVMKLLAKNAEERYQSAGGLEADLVRCHEQLRAGRIVGGFRLAGDDVSNRLEIPQKLYGRWRETQMLLERFGRARQGGRELVLVTGYSGVGKSSLVRELYEPATQSAAFLASGKFDLLQRGTPYSAISSTFSELVKQLLSGSSSELAQWAADLLAALGPNARLLMDVIPALELLLGSQPPVEQSGPLEAQQRLSVAFRDFLRVFCRPAHPLVVFLDDLQWADPASLHLVESMMTDDSLACFLLIGAYRDNEVDGAHPLALLLDGPAARDIPISRIHLEPLGLEDVGHLLADTLHVTPGAVGTLAEHVLRKTGGNPFFLQTFLRLLHEEGLIAFDPAQARWRWNMAQIEAAPATDNVAELLSAKLRKLPDEIRSTLRLAACVGNRFDLHTLSIISGRSIPEIYGSIMEATREGLIEPAAEPEIVPVGESEPRLLVSEYQFTHDRIQQAAYALIAEHERPAIHLEVGRLLWARLDPARRDERLFELVDHLNLGRALLDDGPETEQWKTAALARLDLAAGLRAREAAAYDAAWRYLETGMELCRERWDEHYELMLALGSEAAEVAYCRADFQRSQQLIDAIVPRARSVLAKVRLYRMTIIQHTNQGRYPEAFAVARVALALLSQSLPEPDALAEAARAEREHIEELIGDRSIESLIDLPVTTSEFHQAIMDILGVILPTAYQSDAAMFDFVSARLVRLSLEHGRARASVDGYALYGLALTSRLHEHQRGFEFCSLALALADRLHDAAMKCRAGTAMVNTVYHWARPLRGFEAIAGEAFRAGLQAGELQYAGFVLLGRSLNHFYQGVNLERIRDETRSSLQFTRNHKHTVIANAIEAVRMAATHLSGARDDSASDMADPTAYVERCHAESSLLSLCIYRVAECQVLYMFERYHDALASAQAAEELLPYIPGLLSEAMHAFYYALCLVALLPDEPSERTDAYWQTLARHRQNLARWAESCPEYFRHLELLVTAEVARIAGDDATAVRCYGEAITAADAGEWHSVLPLAHELAARFWLARGQTRYAGSHLREAHYGYGAWGAHRKCEQLEADHGQFLVQPGPVRRTAAMSSTSPVTSTAEHLDLASVLKASQAISSEIALDTLLARLIAVVIENASAQYGALILEHRDELRIEAQGALGEDVRVLQSAPLAPGEPAAERISTAIVQYVLRTRETLVLHDAAREGPFARDPHVVATRLRSVLCMPLLHQGQVRGVLYLVNNLSAQAFTPDRVELLQLLSSQIAISLENARLYHNLRQANQELERLIHSITHDLKEPLRAVHSFSELIVRRYEHALDDQGRDYLGRVMQASERLGDLIEAMRVIAKIRRTTSARERTAGADLVHDALRRLAPAVAESGATVRVAEDLPALTVDRHWAAEAVYQLVHNALRFTRAGQPAEIDIAPYQGSEGAGLLVQDRGLGVPAEDTDRLFDLFRRVVGRDVPGAGVGLTIVRQVASRHDGVAWLRPRAGGGTEAYVTFGR
jgi:predicted ATPase/signal transduction histidine kinase